MKNGRIKAISARLKEYSYSPDNIHELVELLLSFENCTIKTHFLVAQAYVRVGLGKKAVNHLLRTKSSISSGKLEASDKDIKQLNKSIYLCKKAINDDKKATIVANKLDNEFCL